MDWHDIPSLSALRAFEVAARAGSFSKAAQELNVTHAAIAQHVRSVEAHLRVSLLVREGRGMALTPQGAGLTDYLSAGFGQIADGINAVRADAENRPLSISVTPSFAENWLMPRLADFWTRHPGDQVSIVPSMKLVDLRRDGFDLGIRYGNGDWPGLEATPLVRADFTVVATPQLLGGRTVESLDDIQDLPWIFETMHREARNWVEQSGLDFACCQVNEVATLSMLLSAVRAGAGVSVVSSALVADDVASGRLVAVLQKRVEGVGYHIVHLPGVLPDRVKKLKKWLITSARS